VSGPISVAIPGAAAGSTDDFSATKTTSWMPRLSGRSVARMGGVAFRTDPQRDAALENRGELGAARHRRDLDPRGIGAGAEPGRDMAADRPGAEDRYLHRSNPLSSSP
jgi:hypothetical protein